MHVVSSNVGNVSVGLLKSLVDFLLPDVVLPAVNILFNAGLPLPRADGLSLTHTYAGFDQGFVQLASDFTWNPDGGLVSKGEGLPHGDGLQLHAGRMQEQGWEGL